MNAAKPRATCLLLQRRARALKRHLPAAVAGDGIGVHQARVASRRLREALPVLAADLTTPKARKAQRKIRKLTRALGAVRELDVTLAIVDELIAAATLPRVALETVRRHVAEERERRRVTMLKRIDGVPLPKLERRLASVAEALQASTTQQWRKALGTRVTKRAKALGAAVAKAGQMYNPERLHLVRIAAKKLRYGLEIAAEAGVRPAVALVRQLKRTQDALGRLHDLQVLEAHVAAVQAGSTSLASEGGLAQVARALEDDCRHLHGRYMASSPKLQATIEAIGRLVLTHLVQPTRPARGIKMALPVKTTRSVAAVPRAGAAASSRH